MKTGYKKRKFFGLHLKPKAPDFHRVFGAIEVLPPDFNLDAGLTDFNQNVPNAVFGTPAQPEGCTGMTQSDIATDADHIIYSPYFTYQEGCKLANVEVGQPIDLLDSLNSTVVYGLLALGEQTETQALVHRKAPAYEVKPINGSFFQGMVSAMHVGQGSLSFGGTWYESFDNPPNNVVTTATGTTTGHNFKICGLKTINGTPYLIVKPWIGGFRYIPEGIINSLGGEVFALGKPSTIGNPIVRQTVIEALLAYFKDLLKLGSTDPQSIWKSLETELEDLQEELNTLTHKNMNPDTVTYSWDTPAHCYHNTRVLCDNAGLSLDEKNVISACIYQESQFHTQAKHVNYNRNGSVSSTDWGIVQINDYFHIAPTGTPFASVAEVLSNPEADVAWMIQMYKQGGLKMWDSYLSGAYREWLEPNSPMWALAA